MELTVIIPIFNGERFLKELCPRLSRVLDSTGMEYEIIFIDDGCTDGTYGALKVFAGENHRVKIVRFDRNYGQLCALAAGFKLSSGKIVVRMDDDLEVGPECIPGFIRKIQSGYDVVLGWRKKRKGPFLGRILPSYVANLIISLLIGRRIHDVGCPLNARTRDVVEEMNKYNSVSVSLPVIGRFRTAELTVESNYVPGSRYTFVALLKNFAAKISGILCYKLRRVPGTKYRIREIIGSTRVTAERANG